MVTISDLEVVVEKKYPRRTPVTEIGTLYSRLVVAYPDETIGDVLRKMGPQGIGRLPVVSRSDPRRLLGLIGRDDIVRAYEVAITRRAELSHRIKRMAIREEESTEFVEYALTANDGAVGKSLSELSPILPQDCIIVSIHRGDQVIIPHGNTRLQSGDRLTAFVHSDATSSLFQVLKNQDLPPGEDASYPP